MKYSEIKVAMQNAINIPSPVPIIATNLAIPTKLSCGESYATRKPAIAAVITLKYRIAVSLLATKSPTIAPAAKSVGSSPGCTKKLAPTKPDIKASTKAKTLALLFSIPD
ncbi:hypothetical protein OAG1_25640 [Agarivorans sp. OAG1]|nr:hypothetical protein OAG1_25640 [Agarivorans sp. OAG1]